METSKLTLLGVDSNSNQVDSDGNSLLMNAVNNDYFDDVKELVSAGCDVNYINSIDKSSALSIASMFNYIEIFEFLMTSGIDFDKCGGHALINASVQNIYIAKRLLECGVSANFKDSNDRTPLSIACSSDDFEMVKLLMEFGADESTEFYYGNTAINFTSDEKIKEFMKNYNSSKPILK